MSKNVPVIEAEPRDRVGTRYSKRLRQAGRLPDRRHRDDRHRRRDARTGRGAGWVAVVACFEHVSQVQGFGLRAHASTL